MLVQAPCWEFVQDIAASTPHTRTGECHGIRSEVSSKKNGALGNGSPESPVSVLGHRGVEIGQRDEHPLLANTSTGNHLVSHPSMDRDQACLASTVGVCMCDVYCMTVGHFSLAPPPDFLSPRLPVCALGVEVCARDEVVSEPTEAAGSLGHRRDIPHAPRKV